LRVGRHRRQNLGELGSSPDFRTHAETRRKLDDRQTQTARAMTIKPVTVTITIRVDPDYRPMIIANPELIQDSANFDAPKRPVTARRETCSPEWARNPPRAAHRMPARADPIGGRGCLSE